MGEPVRERIVRTENHGRAEERRLDGGCGHAHLRLGFRLAAQVLAGGVSASGQRAHVEQARYALRSHGLDDLGRKLGVYGAESRSAALVQDADEIDDDIHAIEELPQHARVVNVGDDELDGGQHAKVRAVRKPPRGDSYVMALARKLYDQLRPDEAGSTEHADVQRS